MKAWWPSALLVIVSAAFVVSAIGLATALFEHPTISPPIYKKPPASVEQVCSYVQGLKSQPASAVQKELSGLDIRWLSYLLACMISEEPAR